MCAAVVIKLRAEFANTQGVAITLGAVACQLSTRAIITFGKKFLAYALLSISTMKIIY